MAAPNTLPASTRAGRGTGPARQVRRAGSVPAVVYGLGTDTEAISVDAHDLELILHSAAGVNTVVTLKVDGGKDQLALCRQIQRHPVRQSLLHVDFVRVRADVAVQADVPIDYVGEPEGVRNGGMLEQLHFTIPISARPGSIPNSIQCDVSALDLGGQVHVRDLVVPDGVEVLIDGDELLAHVSVPRGLTAEEEGVVAEGEEVEAVEGEGGGEGDEGSEGE